MIVRIEEATANGQSKMAASKLQIRISQFANKTATKLHWSYLRFLGSSYPVWMLHDQTGRNQYNCLNFVAILFIRTQSLEAAILHFSFPVSSYFVVRHCHYSYWIARSRKHAYSRWNCVAILFPDWYIRIGRLEAAISNVLPRTSEIYD